MIGNTVASDPQTFYTWRNLVKDGPVVSNEKKIKLFLPTGMETEQFMNLSFTGMVSQKMAGKPLRESTGQCSSFSQNQVTKTR